ACAGAGTCSVTMDVARSVTATFALEPRTLTVARVGTGTGTVTGAGITCGSDCAETVGQGTSITLTATPSSTPATASTFVGWSGACSGTGSCTVVLTSSTSVTAEFRLAPNLMFVSSVAFTGNLGGLAGADAKCQALAAGANLAGTYRAYLSSIDGNTLITAASRMGSASGWVRVDGATVMNAVTQLASGGLANPPQLTEAGSDVGQSQTPFAWTGTNPAGTFDSTCTNSTVFTPWGGTSSSAMVGAATSTSSAVVALGAADCASAMRLYCLGIDRSAIAP
ncbi:MAG: DUF1554 domain-containing protein, partial [Myxococcota bacterium]|nr:DUF1554 domain-containing protein [Myxococcota bacterium]